MSLVKKEIEFSLAIAFLACVLPYLFPPGAWDAMILISLCLGLLWLICLVAAMVRYRKKGLWFLVGLPFVLYWPAALFMIGWGCAHDVRNCP
jgi:hypothetical protein